MLGVTRFIQARDDIRSSELRGQSKIRDAVAWAKLSKIRWAGHVMRLRDDRLTRAVTYPRRDELHKEGADFELTTNMSNTKFMKNEFADENSVRVQRASLEEVTEYICMFTLVDS
ncbi:unnamed protein product [Nippostrongylus brasiliensis]|uniref:Uncharacterized protein n=1 Tax=Nippostrongylus brasiliensis TaxID=27835 RepID=A0A0N4Y5Z4_NIPBR|nr:unnamed protein product [Nippostrongylus brasiliensis]